MKKENILVVVLICIVLAGVGLYINTKLEKQIISSQENDSDQTSDDSKIEWQAYAQGMELAKAQDKPIFLYFTADWCQYCKKLKKTTFRDKAVLSYLKDNFISISVNTDKNQDIASQWQVRGLPMLWFLKPDNSKINNIPGYIDAKHFLSILKYIHTQSYDNMSLKEFVETI